MDYLNLDFGSALLILFCLIIIILISLFFFNSIRRLLSRMGYVTPVICVVLLLLFFVFPYGEKDFDRAYQYLFNDDKAYYSCVGNADHEVGIKDCTDLIAKLETPQGIVLKDIPNTKGEYWLSEMVSYKGRHLIRMGKLEEGKADFKRALLMEEGTAVTLNNLAEAGYTRQDAFQKDYDASVDAIQASAFCQMAGAILDEGDASIVNHQATLSDEAAKLCRVTTGREIADCKQEMERRISDARARASRIYERADKKIVRTEYDNCKS